MRQLVELNKSAEKFKKAGVDVVAIFREEQKEAEGLKIIKDKTSTEFVLALDNGNKQTAAFASERRDFSSYVVDKNGVITSIIEGDLRNRAKSDQILKEIAKISSGGSSSKGSSTKKGSGRK